jgi:hypothetical protein
MRRAATATCRNDLARSVEQPRIGVSLPRKGWIIALRLEAAHRPQLDHSAATPVTARYKQGMVSPKRIGEIPCAKPLPIEV